MNKNIASQIVSEIYSLKVKYKLSDAELSIIFKVMEDGALTKSILKMLVDMKIITENTLRDGMEELGGVIKHMLKDD